MKRTVDKTKKSNVKCEHCKFWNKENALGTYAPTCLLTCTRHEYYQRCKKFEWSERYE